jgi:hypothetical protein
VIGRGVIAYGMAWHGMAWHGMVGARHLLMLPSQFAQLLAQHLGLRLVVG